MQKFYAAKHTTNEKGPLSQGIVSLQKVFFLMSVADPLGSVDTQFRTTALVGVFARLLVNNEPTCPKGSIDDVSFCLGDLNIARVLAVKWERENDENKNLHGDQGTDQFAFNDGSSTKQRTMHSHWLSRRN